MEIIFHETYIRHDVEVDLTMLLCLRPELMAESEGNIAARARTLISVTVISKLMRLLLT